MAASCAATRQNMSADAAAIHHTGHFHNSILGQIGDESGVQNIPEDEGWGIGFYRLDNIGSVLRAAIEFDLLFTGAIICRISSSDLAPPSRPVIGIKPLRPNRQRGYILNQIRRLRKYGTYSEMSAARWEKRQNATSSQTHRSCS
jgi:hypothetical protein